MVLNVYRHGRLDLLTLVIGILNRIHVPGFHQNMALVFSQANTKAWQNGDKYFTPFNNPFLQPITETPMSVSDYVDMSRGSVPEVTHTYGKVKLFQLVFNSAITEENQLRNRGGITPNLTFNADGYYPVLFKFI